ncbi:MAG: formylglycine-generating enzyme family protein [Burkholderiales bacterium]|nr:formylglycine-generating enzyme family protein [Burkholderiales bacterium]
MLTHQVGLAETNEAISPMNSSLQNAPYQNPSITDQETTTSQEGIKIPSSVSAQTNKLLQPMELDKDCNYCPDLVGVPAGLALLGSLPDEKDRESDEGPIQKVLMKAFAIGKYEVTKAQWRFFIEQSGYTTTQGCLTWVGDGYDKPPKVNWKETGFAQTDDHPVVCVSWLDVKAYTQWLSKISQKSYRLPTEMEWEYVAKADQGLVPFPWPSGESPCNRANLADQSLLRLYPNWRLVGCNDGFEFTSSVGSFAANPWGIYDLQGNVMEWVSDCYSSTIQVQPWKNSECIKRVIKGGGWDMTEKYLRNAYRGRAAAHISSTGIGFRVVRDFE